ncbi:MAG: HAMP domain-containing protein [Proteobacteria bacterium]|nr:HAMP domain-containing protein [Pseudomonadota bacterium]
MKRESQDDGAATVSTLVRALGPAGRIRLWDRYRTRVLLWLIALSAGTSAITGYVYYSQQLGFIRAEQATRGRSLVANLAGRSELGAYSGDLALLHAAARPTFAEPDVSFVVIYDRRGVPLARLSKPTASGAVAPPGQGLLAQLARQLNGPPLQRAARQHIDFFAPVVSVADDAEYGLFGDGGRARPTMLGVAQLGLSRRPAEARLRAVLVAGARVALFVLGSGILIALLLSARISRPILALARSADELREGQLGLQLRVQRRDELGLLAASFNRMSARLHHTMQSLAHLNRTLESEVQRRTDALRRSRDFSALLNAPLRLRHLLDTALAALISDTAALGGAIFLCHDGEAARLEVSAGACASDAATTVLPTGLAERLLAAPDCLELVVAEAAASPSANADARAGRWLHCYSALRFHERTEGIVLLLRNDALDAERREFVRHASAQLAIAVANARAFRAAEELARELEQRNVELLEQRDQLQQVNRLKTEFLANMTHELRTPLNAVLGYAELLADGAYGDVNDEQQQSLQGIIDSAGHLLALIEDVLTLSRMGAGRMTPHLESVDVCRLVQEVLLATAPLAKDRPYRPQASLPPALPPILTDPAKLRQILVNLLGNAIKFTPEGSVTVGVEAQAGGQLRLFVEDTGIGIRAEDLELIFDEFRQVDGSSTREHAGSGLGLAISRQLAGVLGAQLVVSSAPGKGSTFSLLLPASAAGEASVA